MTTRPNPIPIDGVTIVREFDAPVERVFDAWVTPRQVAAWFGVEGVEGDKGDKGGEHDERGEIGEIVTVERPRSLVIAVGAVYLTVLLDDLAGRTRMTFHQGGGTAAPERIQRAKATWQGRFDVLDRLLGEAALD